LEAVGDGLFLTTIIGKTKFNYWAADQTNSLAWGAPLLVMDMYEHAYAMDYGANAGGYIDAFFQNINWDEVNRRAESVHPRSIASSLRSGEAH